MSGVLVCQEMVPAEGIEPPTFGLQIRHEVADLKQIIVD